jgi:hypothetical protein
MQNTERRLGRLEAIARRAHRLLPPISFHLALAPGVVSPRPAMIVLGSQEDQAGVMSKEELNAWKAEVKNYAS